MLATQMYSHASENQEGCSGCFAITWEKFDANESAEGCELFLYFQCHLRQEMMTKPSDVTFASFRFRFVCYVVLDLFLFRRSQCALSSGTSVKGPPTR